MSILFKSSIPSRPLINLAASDNSLDIKKALRAAGTLVEIIECTVEGFDTYNKTYEVKPVGSTNSIPAYMLLDAPQTGEGVTNMYVPSNYFGASCVCLRLNGTIPYLILGFSQVRGLIAAGNTSEDVELEPGTRTIRGSGSRSSINIYKSGLISLVADALSTVLQLDPAAAVRRFYLMSDNAEVILSKGATKFINKVKEKLNNIKIVITKEVEELPKILKKDSIEVELGDLGDKGNHLVEAKLSQDYMATVPNHVTTWKFGKQDDGKIVSMNFEDTATQVKAAVYIDGSSGKFQYTASNSTGDTCNIAITPSGDINISTTNKNAKIIIGGEGNEQPLVTKAWLDNIFSKHIHPTSAGPTSAPIPLTIPLSTGDAATNPLTNTLMAE